MAEAGLSPSSRPARWLVESGQVWQGILAAVLEVVCIAVLVSLAQGGRATRLDRRIAEWVATHSTPVLDTLANMGTSPGTLPAAVALTLLMLAVLRYRRRPLREKRSPPLVTAGQ